MAAQAADAGVLYQQPVGGLEMRFQSMRFQERLSDRWHLIEACVPCSFCDSSVHGRCLEAPKATLCKRRTK
jgi:hypothetical protein